MAEKLGKNIGFSMGIDFRESALVLNAKNETVAKKGKFPEKMFDLNIFQSFTNKKSVLWLKRPPNTQLINEE